MTKFEMIKYHNLKYPKSIPLRIEEVAAHFDVRKIETVLDRSLHTEYSYGKRKFDSNLIKKFSVITESHKNNVPQLWKDIKWSNAFASFIFTLNGLDAAPKIIEIHPPFSDYSNINSFIESYSAFEYIIKSKFPEAEILIENRCGSIYRGGKFIISDMNDIEVLCEHICKQKLYLKIAFDIPQIYTAHNAATAKEHISLLNRAKSLREYIGGIHLWGKKHTPAGRRISHCGDLNSYFDSQIVKEHFLRAFFDCFNDDVIRKMVLEVNSGNEDLLSIISDLFSVNIAFV